MAGAAAHVGNRAEIDVGALGRTGDRRRRDPAHEGQSGRPVSDGANDSLGDVDDVCFASRVDLAHDVTGAVIIFVQIGEEVQHGNITGVEGAVVGRPVSVA